MHEIDKVIINFDEGQLFLLNICLGFLMFGVSLELSLKDFRYVFQRPKPVVVGLISQLVLLPVLTLILIYFIRPAYTIQLGMMMVAACPGGNISNYLVHRSNGNTALSITLTSIVTLLAVLTTPFSFYFWTRVLDAPDDFNRPISLDLGNMISIIVQLIVIPLLIGLIINQQAPKFRAFIIKPVKIFSIVLLLAIIGFALLGNQEIIRHHLAAVFFIVLIHNGLAYLQGFYFARLNQLPEKDVRAIAMETGIQNSGLGLILIFNYFYGLGGMAVLAAWWGVWDIISGFLLSSYWSYKKID